MSAQVVASWPIAKKLRVLTLVNIAVVLLLSLVVLFDEWQSNRDMQGVDTQLFVLHSQISQLSQLQSQSTLAAHLLFITRAEPDGNNISIQRRLLALNTQFDQTKLTLKLLFVDAQYETFKVAITDLNRRQSVWRSAVLTRAKLRNRPPLLNVKLAAEAQNLGRGYQTWLARSQSLTEQQLTMQRKRSAILLYITLALVVVSIILISSLTIRLLKNFSRNLARLSREGAENALLLEKKCAPKYKLDIRSNDEVSAIAKAMRLMCDVAVSAQQAVNRATLQSAAAQTVDVHSGAFNHSRFIQMMPTELERSQRYKMDLSIIGFALNDQSAHLIDELAPVLVEVVAHHLRTTDLIFRIDTNLFMIMCLNTAGNNACTLAERICKDLAAMDALQSRQAHLNMSMIERQYGDSLDQIRQRVIEQLDKARRDGVDKVSCRLA